MTTPIFSLCAEHVARYAALDPVYAAFRGVDGHDAGATDFSPDGYAARADLWRDTLRRLDALTATGEADRRAAAHLRERLEADLAWHDAGEWMSDVRGSFGLLQSVRDGVELIRHDGDDGWRNVASRLSSVPRMLAGWRTTLDLGLAAGAAGARRQAVEAAITADTYARTATHDALVRSYGDGPLRPALAEAARAAHQAYADIARYLREQYAPRAPDADGVGERRYRVAVRRWLGADLDPFEAYEWGWAELYRLESAMAAEAARIRPGAGLDEVCAALDETESVPGATAYREWLQAEHERAIERLDGVHFDIAPPLRRIEVVLAPEANSAGVYYSGPTEDGSRPGRTWWSVAGRSRFAVWRELTTVFHEGVPGHHLQVGQARLAGDGLSRFSRVNGVSGHSEGWALYAENLADELGWLERPGTRLGMLEGSAMRAARVIIDIGLHLDLPLPAAEVPRHGRRWTFETACEVLRQRGRCAEHRVHSEVVRYCGWPAQATAYKLGERAWLAARAEAQAALGARFDLKRWHTAALGVGPMGLATLAETLRRQTVPGSAG